jgi:hypothetical protein
MVPKRKTSKFSKKSHKNKTRKVLGGLTKEQIEELKNRSNKHMFEYKLLSWIPRWRLDSEGLSTNPNAIDYLEKNPDKIFWYWLCKNPNAIPILEKNLDKVYWPLLSENPNAIRLLEKKPDKIYWPLLSRNPNAIHLLEENPDKVDWKQLSKNPNAISLIEKNLDKKIDEVNWKQLSKNPNAISILENNLNMVDWLVVCSNPNPKIIAFLERHLDLNTLSQAQWKRLSANPNAIHLLEENQDKVDWKELSKNPNAIRILQYRLDMVDPVFVCSNPNPKIIPFLEEYLDLNRLSKDQWEELSANPNAIPILQNANFNLINWKELSANPSIFYRSIDDEVSFDKELKDTFDSRNLNLLNRSKTHVPEELFDKIKGYFGGKRKTTKRRK